ncbi:MAG: zinc metallopeptidase [Candidatus Omnitrophica bacterium]|nr:zinc metallopeptidase [Candidatus Omnitrophota bacterium]
MQQGFFVLWCFSVVASAVSWFYLKVFLTRFGSAESRRRMTGSELARQVLDRHGAGRRSIHSYSGAGRAHFPSRPDGLLLSEAVYDGTKLSDLSLALHEASHFFAGTPSPVPGNLRAGAGHSFGVTILVSWGLVLLGTLFPALKGLAGAGEFLFLAIFLFTFSGLREEWEVTEGAAGALTKLEGFEVDERVAIRRILAALPFLPFAELFATPFSFLKTRKKIPVKSFAA